jgi:hypothetical protein
MGELESKFHVCFFKWLLEGHLFASVVASDFIAAEPGLDDKDCKRVDFLNRFRKKCTFELINPICTKFSK